MSEFRRYPVAVVQRAVYTVNDRQPVSQTIAENALRLAAEIDDIYSRKERPPRFIVFPALALSGMGEALRQAGSSINDFPGYPRVAALSLTSEEPLLAPILDACRRQACYVATSCVERVPSLGDRLFHTAFVLGPDGVALRSPKIQARTAAGVTLLRDVYEEYVATFGAEGLLPVAETPYGRIGCMAHQEMLAPESARVLSRKGADLILHVTGERTERTEPPHLAFKQALAYANGVYWLSAGASREITVNEKGTVEVALAGGSTIVAPDGKVLVRVDGAAEAVATAWVDLDFLNDVRKRQGPQTLPPWFVARI